MVKSQFLPSHFTNENVAAVTAESFGSRARMAICMASWSTSICFCCSAAWPVKIGWTWYIRSYFALLYANLIQYIYIYINKTNIYIYICISHHYTSIGIACIEMYIETLPNLFFFVEELLGTRKNPRRDDSASTFQVEIQQLLHFHLRRFHGHGRTRQLQTWRADFLDIFSRAWTTNHTPKLWVDISVVIFRWCFLTTVFVKVMSRVRLEMGTRFLQDPTCHDHRQVAQLGDAAVDGKPATFRTRFPEILDLQVSNYEINIYQMTPKIV